MGIKSLIKKHRTLFLVVWLVGCFGFNGPLRQYFSLYRAISQREGERKEGNRRVRVKMSKPPPPAPTASAIGPCPTVIKIVGRPGTGSLPSTIAPPDHPPPVLGTTLYPIIKPKCCTYQIWKEIPFESPGH